MAEVVQASTSFPDFGLPHGNEYMDLSDDGGGVEGGAEEGNQQLLDPTSTTNKHLVSLFGNPNETSIQPPNTDPDVVIREVSDNDRQFNLARPNLEIGAFSGAARTHDTEGESPVFSEDTTCNDYNDILASFEDPIETYGLRKNINRLGAASTHIDIDQSGDYDPAEEARRGPLTSKATKRPKQTRRSKGNNSGITKHRVKGKASLRSSDEPAFKRIVRLQIRAMGSVLNITDGKDNWPEDHSMVDSDEEAERREFLSFYRRRAPDSPNLVQAPIIDPTGEEKDLTGHPEARGCKECRLQSVHCSMVVDGHHPCTTCRESDIDCYPIMEPNLTVRCERCENQGIPCSLENLEPNNSTTDDVCTECLEAGNLSCKPSRTKRYGNQRIDLDQKLYGVNRKYKDCTHCREQKRKCSLKKSSDKPPCTRCKKERIGCHFYEVSAAINTVSQKFRKRKGGKDRTTEEDAAEVMPTLLKQIAPEVSVPTSELFSAEDIAYMQGGTLTTGDEHEASAPEDTSSSDMIEDMEGHQGFLTSIKTCFAHPMIFSVEPSGHHDAILYCNFCQMGTFGMVGHFEREVHVIEWADGLGYTEMGNGHREGNDQTMMCQTCTYNRLQIIGCPEHALQKMDFTTPSDLNSAADDLISLNDNPGETQLQLQRWCSMCFTLATHMCCTPQPSMASIEEDECQTIREGCGLRLCNECAGKFGEVYGYDLNSMVVAFDKEPKPAVDEENDEYEGETSGTIRADVGLLNSDGLLMRCVTHDMDD